MEQYLGSQITGSLMPIPDKLKEVKGNYCRTMLDAMYYLMKCYLTEKSIGEVHENWLNAIARFCDKFVELQNTNGSWNRAYSMEGQTLTNPPEWFGASGIELESGTNTPEVEVSVPEYKQFETKRADDNTYFKWELPMNFQTLRQPADRHWIRFGEETGCLKLFGKESMESLHRQSLIGRRREDFKFTAQTCIEFIPVTYQQMAGLALYYDTANYIYLHKTWDEKNGKILCLLECDHGRQKVADRRILPENEDKVHLRMAVNNDLARFYYSLDGEVFHSIGQEMDATHMSDDYYDAKKTGLRFTGTFIALCAQDISGQRIRQVSYIFLMNRFD